MIFDFFQCKIEFYRMDTKSCIFSSRVAVVTSENKSFGVH